MKNYLQSLTYIEQNLPSHLDAIFPCALILDALSSCCLTTAQSIKSRLAKLLLREKCTNASFNYWFVGAKQRQIEAYPNDLDDTCCAWLALSKYQESLLGARDLRQLMQLLLASQVQRGGPYYAWLVNKADRNNWQEIDLVVNINVARFLHRLGAQPPGLSNYLETEIGKTFHSSFYPHPLLAYYFLSDFYHGKHLNCIKHKLGEYLRDFAHQGELVLVVNTIYKFAFTDLLTPNIVKQVDSLSRKTGIMPAFPLYFYRDPQQLDTSYYSSAVLSTAYYVEFLTLRQQHQQQLRQQKTNDLLLQKVEHVLKVVPNTNLKQAVAARASTLINDKHSNWTIFLASFLSGGSSQIKTAQSLLLSLAIINLLAWLAYEIYDDFNDLELAKSKSLLPVANLCLQLLIAETINLPRGSTRVESMLQLLQLMEINFMQEQEQVFFDGKPWSKVTSLRVKDWWELNTHKSIGQLFCVQVVLDELKISAVEQKIVKSFCQSLLFLQQAQDDFHDWLEDLQRGQLNLVNYLLLQEISVRTDRDQLLTNSEQLKHYFCFSAATNIFAIYHKYLKQAQVLYQSSDLLRKNVFFKKILSFHARIIARERRNIAFMRLTYENPLLFASTETKCV